VIFFAPYRSGSRIATAGGDGTVEIWDATTGEPLLGASRHIGATTYVSFDAEDVGTAELGVTVCVPSVDARGEDLRWTFDCSGAPLPWLGALDEHHRAASAWGRIAVPRPHISQVTA
jgi:WD40 repeat protein